MASQPYLTTRQRPCSLYRIYVLDPRTNYKTITLGYIGETGRMPFTRFIEHLYEQPFGDTIVGHPEVDPRIFAGKDAVVAAEQAAVEAEKPLYNIEFNLGNTDRIRPWEAQDQRRRRETAKGNPRWVPGKAQPQRQPTRPEHAGLGRRWKVAWLAAGWLLLFVGAIGMVQQLLDGWVLLAAAAGLATAPFLLALIGRMLGGPTRRRR